PEGQVVGRNRGLQSGEDEDLLVARDLEDGAGAARAAVPDVKILFRIEGQAGGDAHALDVDLHVAVGSHLVDMSFEAAGDVQHALAIEVKPVGVHDVVDERLDVIVQVDFVTRHRNLLAARAAEGGIDVARGIY